METAYSLIQQSPTNKQEAERFAEKLISEVQEGMVNPLELHVKLTAMEKAISEVKKQIQPLTLQEAEKFKAKSFDAYSAEITIKETGVKYDFSNTNDVEWNEANDKEKEQAEIRKEREKFLKALSKPMELVMEGTGEVVKIYPPLKSSTTNVAITLK